MSRRELGRVEVLARVRSGQLRLVDAAVLLRLSYRQTKRLWKRYREEGAAGLKHRSAGRRSHRAYAEKFREKVLALVREKYGGPVGERFGPTLAAEHLASEDGQRVDAETLRRWMREEGLWSRERRRRRHRRRRERKEHFGELVQMDGSFHPWLEERGPQGCLMDLVDDATNTTLARLGQEETIWAAAGALRAWIERYGVPMRLYVDWKNLYKRLASSQERVRGEEPITQFGRMCAKLGIELIAASSPQAKGRVDRIHGTHQDRLVKKLRRKKIASHAEANAYLEAEYLPEHNRRFARPAARREDYHRRAPCAEAGQGLPVGEQTDDQRRLGGALRQPVFPAGPAEPELRPGARQSRGLRVARGAGGHRISRSGGAVAGDCGARQAPGRRADRRAGSAAGKAEVGAAGGSSLATSHPARGGEASRRRRAIVVGLALRFALNARPTGSQGCAPGKANDDDKNQSKN